MELGNSPAGAKSTPKAKIRKPMLGMSPFRARMKKAPKGMQSLARDLFFGRVTSHIAFPFPKPNDAEKETLAMVIDSVDRLSQDPDAKRIEEEKLIPAPFMQKMKDMGFFGLVIPEEFGGLGFSNSAYAETLSFISLVDPSLTATLGAHQSIGHKALLMFGNQKQKEAYLPKLSTGEWIAAFALTEPGAGSDAQSIISTAKLSPDGSHYILNGNKIWITNGGIAHFFTVFAKTTHADGHGGEKEKVTAFIVTRDMTGFSSGPEEKKMGMVGSSTTPLHFENVKVPVENVLGEAGKGFKIAVSVLNNGRLAVAAACALGSKRLIQQAMEHALQRRQFGQPLSEFGLIQSKIANMVMETFAAESMVRVTANLMDEGKYDYALESAMCKIFCTEAEWRTVNECLQISGGSGYMKEYNYEKILRDSRIFTIWEGTNEVLRLFVGLSGLQGPGQQLKELADALKKPFSDVLGSIGILSDYSVRWLQKKVANPEGVTGYHPTFEREAQILNKYTAALATETDRALRKEGKAIIKNQFVVKRLADIAIDLYALVCTLSRGTSLIKDNGVENSEHEINIVKGFFRKTRRTLDENLRLMSHNDDKLESAIANGLYQRGGYVTNGRFLPF